jgi:hypothetical protein
MNLRLLFAFSLMAICVTMHAVGLMGAVRWMKRRPAVVDGRLWPAIWMLVCLAGWVILMHLLQVTVWALFYTWKQTMPDFDSALYFSAVTYTTTGYGDLVLPREWHLAGGVEALTGILMCGLSTGFFIAIVSKLLGTYLGDERNS